MEDFLYVGRPWKHIVGVGIAALSLLISSAAINRRVEYELDFHEPKSSNRQRTCVNGI